MVSSIVVIVMVVIVVVLVCVRLVCVKEEGWVVCRLNTRRSC